MELKGKVAIVTGAGRGLGKAIAKAMAKEGARLAIVSRTMDELKLAAKEIGSSDDKILMLKVDISKEDDVNKMVKGVVSKFGTVDILVNNASVIGPMGPTTQIGTKEWINAINVNLIGTFLCTRAVLPTMVKKGHGKIINIAGSGSGPLLNFTAYASSKSGMMRFTEVLAEEVKDSHVDVNAVAPGGIKTKMTEEERIHGTVGEEHERAAKILETGGTPLEIPASCVVFLASDKSDGISGKIISAVNDNWKDFPKIKEELSSSEMYTMRRIDPYMKEKLAGKKGNK